ncbi:MAG: hypothetical protein DRN15_08755 [Thermoprotei archaeon]|nr:MAG: hypothetical protein DRM97_07465 [Thermoprotei archaeon]RLF22517.1 MAG: hypothetical protein DRN15_08755 [Thermoprotei archaeon]
MEALEYYLVFISLIACLCLTLSLIKPPEPIFGIRLLLTGISSIAYKPTSEVTIRLYVPKSVIISIHDNVIEVKGYAINYAEIRDFIRLGIVKAYSQDKLELYMSFKKPIELTGSAVYELKLTCIGLDMIDISILNLTELRHF